jgi:zinc protease
LYSAWPKAADLQYEKSLKLGASAVPGLNEQDGMGLLYDRDVLAFYGDPAADVVMPKKWRAYEQELTAAVDKAGVTQWTLSMTGNAGADSFATVNNNGSQRGGRPIIQFLPHGIDPASVKIIEGAELKPVIGVDWILVPKPSSYVAGQLLRVKFEALDKN